MQSEHRPPFGRIVYAVDLGAALGVEGSVGDGVPGVALGLGEAFEQGLLVDLDVGLSGRHEDAEHAGYFLDLLEGVRA